MTIARRVFEVDKFGRSDLLYLPLTALLVLFVTPLLVVATNVDDFGHLSAGWVLTILGALALVGAVIGLILSMMARAVGAWPVLVIGRLVFFFCLLSGLALPLAGSAGQENISDIPVNRLNLLIAALGALILTAATFTRLRGLLLAAAVVIVAGNGVSGGLQVITSIPISFGSPPPEQRNSLFEASSTKNQFVLSFDGLPRDVVLEVLRENSELAAALADFDVFENVMGSGPATMVSMVSELTGVRNLLAPETALTDADVPTLVDDARIPFLTNVLAENGIEVATYNYPYRDREHSYRHGSLERDSDIEWHLIRIAEVLDYGLLRTLSRHAAIARSAARHLIRLVPAGDGIATEGRTLRAKLAQRSDWDAPYVTGVIEFKRYLEQLAVATDEPKSQLLHFIHTHFPVDFDANCTYRSDDSEWYVSAQNRDGIKEQAKCAVSQFASFLARLKEIGAYDNAVIVLKSDHGEPVGYNDPSAYEGFTIRDHPLWGFGRYMPFLAIKQRNASRSSMALDGRHVALADLAKTLCEDAIGDTYDCDLFGGLNLLESAPIPDEATYFAYVVKDADSYFTFDALEPIEFSRKPEFLTALNDYLTDELSIEPSPCEAVTLASGEAYNNGWSDGKRWVTWWNRDTAYLKFASPRCTADTLVLTFAPKDQDASASKVSILANGIALASERQNDGQTIKLSLRPVPTNAGRPVALTIRGLDPAAFEFKGFQFIER